MRKTVPAWYAKEDKMIADLWINSDMEYDEVVELYASDKYKQYLKRRRERAERLWRRGIIEE